MDAAIVATGHYDKPYDPPAEPGKQQWEKKFPTSIIHAHDFKNVTPFIRKVSEYRPH